MWKQNGVWAEENGRPVLLRPHHFAWRPAREGDVGAGPLGMPIDFLQDYMVPFFREFTKGIRSVMPHAVIFAVCRRFRHPRAVQNRPIAPNFPRMVTPICCIWGIASTGTVIRCSRVCGKAV